MQNKEQESFVRSAVEAVPLQGLTLDASILDMEETHEIMREDVKQNRIIYEFPEGLNQVDVFEEARALTTLEDFDAWYDLAMQMLAGKPVAIHITNLNGSKSELCAFQVTDRYMNLRGVDAISEYPWIVVWMVEFIKGHVSKKFPLPGAGPSRPQAAESASGKKTKKKKAEQTAT